MDKQIDLLKRYRIGVLAGGSSSEREISIKSGKAVFKALQGLDLNTVFINVNEDVFSSLVDAAGINLAFIALHGRFGEDGTVQRILESKDIPYTGSDSRSSHLALDKIASRERFADQNLRTPACVVVQRGENIAQLNIAYPCVVKPRYEGSSIGLSVVRSGDHIEKAVNEAFKFGKEAIIEDYIPGRELTVGILEAGPLPVVEIVAADGIYDFDAKYRSEGTKYIVPAELDDEIYKQAQQTGLKAHKALGCRGFSRVDMRLSDKRQLFVLEVNTIPGLTERSLLPIAAKKANMDFSQLCIKMLWGALDGKRNRKPECGNQKPEA
jgi:D-alanine-D-alanine ligase